MSATMHYPPYPKGKLEIQSSPFVRPAKEEGICIVCPHCKGVGKVNLPRRLRETLNYVEAGYSTATEIQTEFLRDIGITAVNNRLEDLRKLGIIKRHKQGKQWIYTL